MAAGARITGVRETTFRLQRTGERTTSAALAALREGAKKIQEQARSNAPVKTGDLERAIDIRERMDGSRKVLEVFVNTRKFRTKHMRQYYVRYHESPFSLGKKSQAKADAGHDVGPKYIERAVIKYRASISKKVKQATEKAWK